MAESCSTEQAASVKFEKAAPGAWTHQGDVYREVAFIDRYDEVGEEEVIQKVTFPLSVVLGQECDLASDGALRSAELPPGRSQRPDNQDAALLSVLMMPLYDATIFWAGLHCSDFVQVLYMGTDTHPSPVSLKRRTIGSDEQKRIRGNRDARYQFLEISSTELTGEFIADFKQYFSVPVDYLMVHREQCCGHLATPFREALSQRFAYFISRIGLPEKSGNAGDD